MFEASLVESTSMLRRRSRWPMAFSFAAQAVIVAALIMLPLLHPEAIPMMQLRLATLAPPPPVTPPRPPPPSRPLRVVAAVSNAMAAPVAHAAVLSTTRVAAADPGPAPTTGAIGSMTGMGDPLSTLPGVGAPAGRAVGIATAGTGRGGSVRISTGVSAGLLLAPIRPVYPQIARISRTEGTVVVDAIITKTGAITSAHVVSGSPMLAGAAIDAVRSARYHPYLLNGQPTEVETTISIVFRLSS